MSAEVTVRLAAWLADGAALAAVRCEVFVEEQGVPVELEQDGLDDGCEHAIAVDPAGRPVGAARMRPDGHLGRIAVLAPWRGRGIGSRLVRALVERAAARGLGEVDLDSQTHAVAFYQRLGFAARGEEFMEAGIPHRNMVRRLGNV